MKRLAILFCISIVGLTSCNQKTKTVDSSASLVPLPSWKDGLSKSAIIQFVDALTTEGSSNYVKPEERIATFDNDGTLWCEQPVAQLEFVSYQIKKMAISRPEWKEEQLYKLIIEGNKNC
jgi:hypothetical protein